MNNFTSNELAEHFENLDGIRESGVCNMFGAAEYVDHEDRRVRSKILTAWMKTFSERSTLDRAATALESNLV